PEIVSEQDCPSLGVRSPRYSNLRVGGNVGVLKIRLHHPPTLRIAVDQVVDLRIVEVERCRQRILRVGPGIPGAYKGQGVRGIESISQGARQPGITVRVEAVIPTQCSGPLLIGLVELYAAVDGVFLIPKQTALDV